MSIVGVRVTVRVTVTVRVGIRVGIRGHAFVVASVCPSPSIVSLRVSSCSIVTW